VLKEHDAYLRSERLDVNNLHSDAINVSRFVTIVAAAAAAAVDADVCRQVDR